MTRQTEALIIAVNDARLTVHSGNYAGLRDTLAQMLQAAGHDELSRPLLGCSTAAEVRNVARYTAAALLAAS